MLSNNLVKEPGSDAAAGCLAPADPAKWVEESTFGAPNGLVRSPTFFSPFATAWERSEVSAERCPSNGPGKKQVTVLRSSVLPEALLGTGFGWGGLAAPDELSGPVDLIESVDRRTSFRGMPLGAPGAKSATVGSQSPVPAAENRLVGSRGPRQDGTPVSSAVAFPRSSPELEKNPWVKSPGIF
jgi:hypothetical protein